MATLCVEDELGGTRKLPDSFSCGSKRFSRGRCFLVVHVVLRLLALLENQVEVNKENLIV